MDLHLTGKSVVVLASSSGLGRATAAEFLREGAHVTVSSSNPAKLAQAVADLHTETGRKPLAVVADITRPDDIERLIATAAAAHGGIYTLVNNCGGPPAGPFDSFDDQAWVNAFSLTLLSYVRATRAALPHLRDKQQQGGRVISFTSASMKAPIDNLILSNTFRTGVVGWSKSLAVELGPDNILVNVVGPGRIQTPRIDHLDTMRAQKTGATLEQIQADSAKQIPLGRTGTPDEMARLVAFLGSPANTYVTGQALLADGGATRAY